MIPSVTKISKTGVTTSDVYSDEFAKRRIYLTGEINDVLATDICAQINYLSPQSKEDIYLIIQSPGGSISAGLSILDTMNSSCCAISTIVNGSAASMGAFLAAAGTKGKRLIGQYAEMMIHQPLGGASGQVSDIERTANHIIRIKHKMNTLLAEFTGHTYKKICNDCDRDYYLDAEQAIDYGLVDSIFIGFGD